MGCRTVVYPSVTVTEQYRLSRTQKRNIRDAKSPSVQLPSLVSARRYCKQLDHVPYAQQCKYQPGPYWQASDDDEINKKYNLLSADSVPCTLLITYPLSLIDFSQQRPERVLLTPCYRRENWGLQRLNHVSKNTQPGGGSCFWSVWFQSPGQPLDYTVSSSWGCPVKTYCLLNWKSDCISKLVLLT